MDEKKMRDEILAMSHEELARLWRFAPIGDPRLQPPLGELVQNRLKEFGGIPADMSKRLGW